MTSSDWTNAVPGNMPPEGDVVMTKIDDSRGVRNETTLVYRNGLWWLPDMSMYIYYIPTHWKAVTK